jgi:hypothetical protein
MKGKFPMAWHSEDTQIHPKNLRAEPEEPKPLKDPKKRKSPKPPPVPMINLDLRSLRPSGDGWEFNLGDGTKVSGIPEAVFLDHKLLPEAILAQTGRHVLLPFNFHCESAWRSRAGAAIMLARSGGRFSAPYLSIPTFRSKGENENE